MDQQLFTVARHVWLERARRRPFSALTIIVVLSLLTTALCFLLTTHAATVALTAPNVKTVAPSVFDRLSHVVLVLLTSIGFVSLCDWILRIETPGYSKRALRYAWGWKAFEDGTQIALPHGQMALFTICALLAWPGPSSALTLIGNYAVWSAGIFWLTMSNVLRLREHKGVRKLVKREAERAEMLICFAGLTCAFAQFFHMFIIGAFVVMGLIMAIVLSVPFTIFQDRFWPRLQSRLFEFSLRAVPGLFVLAGEAAVPALWARADFLHKHVDAQLGFGLGAVVFVSAAGFVAARLFERHCRRGSVDRELTPQGDIQAIFSIEVSWRKTFVRGLLISFGALGIALLYLAFLNWLSPKVPWFVQLPADIVAMPLLVAACVIAIVANTMPYSSLCDVPRQKQVLGRIERVLNQRPTL